MFEWLKKDKVLTKTKRASSMIFTDAIKGLCIKMGKKMEGVYAADGDLP